MSATPMKSQESRPQSEAGRDWLRQAPDFSLVLGGPLYPAAAPGAPVGRCAAAGAPAHHRHRARVLAAAAGAFGSGRAPAGRQRGRAVPLRRGSPHPLSGGAAAVDRCRTGGAPPPALDRQAIPGTAPDSRARDAAVRGRDRSGIQAAQLGARRGSADRLRVWRRHPDRLAPLSDARHGHLVRDAVRRGLEADRSPASGTAPSACRSSSSCCCAGTSACSSGRASSGRCRASS